MPSIADYVRQFCKQEAADAPIQWVWAVHDGKFGVLWTIVHDDGRVFEQRHYPNIATTGAARGPVPARLVGQAQPEEMRRFAATLVAQGFDWIQIPLLPDAILRATASQQLELTVTAGEARSHLRCPAAALERTPRLREIARAFERVIEQAAQYPPSAREAMTNSPLRAAVQQWRAKEISGTALMRRLVGYESWFVPIPAAAVEEVSTEGAPSRVMVSRDAEGKRRLLLYSDPAACAQFRWVSADAAEGGAAAEKQHYLTADGTWVFRLPLGKVDELVIDPGMDHETTYGREQFERLRQMADALELEAALVQLRADAERLDELMPLLWGYPNYTVAIHNKAGKPPQFAVARDAQSRTLAAVFTFDDCFDAFQAEDAKGRYSDELVEQTAIPAPELFEQLAGMDAAGVVFNCAGPVPPVVFSMELARFIWETHLPAPPLGEEGGEQPGESSGEGGLVFDGDAYRLQYAAGDETMLANEFLPEDQTSEDWSRMLAVRLYFRAHDPVEHARSLEARLKESNPEAYSRLESGADGEEAIFDFLTWADDDAAQSAEFHIFRLMRHPRGLLEYQLAFRPAMAGVSKEDVLHQGDHLVELMKKTPFPEPIEKP